MIYRLKKDDGSIVYPFAKEQLRSSFSNTSFPFPISDETAAEYGCLPVHTIEHPEHDPRTQRLVEGDPEELDSGILRQVLTVRDATVEEIAAWDASNQPSPDWSTFKTTALGSASLNAIVAQALSAVPVAAASLAPALLHAESYGPADFAAAWSAICAAVPVPAEVIAGFQEVATACNLPAEFVAALAPVAET